MSSPKRYEELLFSSAPPSGDFPLTCAHVFVHQEADEGHLEAVDLALDAEDLVGKLDFLRVGFDEVTLILNLFRLFCFGVFLCQRS